MPLPRSWSVATCQSLNHSQDHGLLHVYCRSLNRSQVGAKRETEADAEEDAEADREGERDAAATAAGGEAIDDNSTRRAQ